MRILRWFDLAVYLAWYGWVAAHPQDSARYWVALAVAAVGFAFWITARVQLGNAFSVGAKASYLVTTGLYSKIRNPVYFFGHIAILATMVAWGRWIWVALVVMGIPFQMARAYREQQVLEAAFGDEYRRYKKQTWF
jgi:protein-S-isoprenylcysteine O-methyltransferase Ste14